LFWPLSSVTIFFDQKKMLHPPCFRHQQDGDTMIGMDG